MKPESSLASVVRRTVSSSKGLTAVMLLIVAGTIVTALIPPWVLGHTVNLLTSHQRVPLTLGFLFFGTIALSGLLESAKNIIITKFGQKVTHGIRSEMCVKLQSLPAAYFTRNEPGIVTSQFVNDVDTIAAMFTNGIISMFVDIFKVISILAVIFYKSTGLGLMMVFIIPLMFALTRLFQKRILKAQLANRIAISKVNNHVPETIRNIRMIHTLFCQKYMEQKYDDYIEESYLATDKSNLYDSIYSPMVIFINACIIAIMMILAASGGQVQQFFGMTVGTAVAMIAYVNSVFEPLESIGMEIQNIQSAVAGIKRINSFLQEPERNSSGSINKEQGPGEPYIQFDHVSFAYDDENPLLVNLSFTVKKGEAVTFFGRTGAGKSTLFRLLLGLYSPNEGNVIADGTNAAFIPDSKKRSLFGYVEQSFHLVSGSVFDQISLFHPDISMKQVEEAAKLVGLHESISALENGYDTPADKAAFSQGQFQLLSIARAVAAAPDILLLDEITANLDRNTELQVLEALKRASKGRTVLSISHRLHGYVHDQRSIQIG